MNTNRYQFEAVAIERAGTYSEATKNIVSDIGHRSTEATGDQRGTFWFNQRLSLRLSLLVSNTYAWTTLRHGHHF